MSQSPLVAGDLAPDFTLSSTTGGPVHLYGCLERSSVVLFFYVKAFTPVCMAEVCSFRDNALNFSDLNATIYGISSDNEGVARSFAKFHQLPFPLLLDEGGCVRESYRVPKMLKLFPGRSTYVIGQNRRILEVIHAGLESHAHMQGSLDVLRGCIK